MSEKELSKASKALIRSLLSADDYKRFEKSGVFNLGSSPFNRMVDDLEWSGALTTMQHARLKKRLASCDLNVHLDERPDAKRYGSFVLIQGGKA